MLNLIDNWKYYILFGVIIALSSLNLSQWVHNALLSHKYEVCQNDAIAVEIGSQNRVKQDKLIEEEAAISQAESLKRRDEIQNKSIGSTCEDAIKFLIDNKPI